MAEAATTTTATTTPTTTPADTAGSGDTDTDLGTAGTGADADGSGTDDKLGEAGKKALEAERARASEADKRARTLQRELDALKRNALPDAERAAADAEARGRLAAQVEFGQQLARSEFAVAAAAIDPTFQVSSIAEDVNWSRFVGPDGERDSAAIAAAARRLVPKPSAEAPSFDGGARTAAKTTDMNQIIRNASRR